MFPNSILVTEDNDIQNMHIQVLKNLLN